MLRRDLRVDNPIGYSLHNSELISMCETAKSEEHGG